MVYHQAMAQANCHADSAVPGYVDYGIYHGANLKVDFQHGRLVFYYCGC